VGLSNAVLLAQHNEVVDIELNLRAALDKAAAYTGASFVIIATPLSFPHSKPSSPQANP
jgi:hypothetical protein